MKKTSLLFLFCCLSFAGFAQTATQYTFARATGTYTAIVGLSGTTSTTGLSDDDLTQGSIPIGFNFVFCGATSTALSACSNGWISLSNSGSTEYDNTASTVPGAGTLMPFWNDLDGSVGTATAFYQTSGTAPTRVFTFQWGHTSPATQRWGNLYGTGRAVFQVKLYENSNVVQFVYGAGNFASNAATIGIANSTSDFRTLTAASSTTSVSTFQTGVASSPAANSVMTWTPPPTIRATPSTLVFTTGPSTTTSPQNVTLTAYGLTSGNVTVTAPANFQVFNGTTWVSSMTVATSAAAVGTYINTTVQVRFVGPATIGVYTGNLAFTSTGATTQNVGLTGNVTAPCSGTPAAGTVTASATSGSCSSYSSTLSLSGATVAAGITYQWQSSTDNASWLPVAGATNATYTATIGANIYYRCQVMCGVANANTPGLLFTFTNCITMPSSGSGSATTCNALFYDSGGPSGSYLNNETGVYTIHPGNPSSKVVVTFSQLYIEACCDGLSIYNGNSTGAPLIGTYNGEPHSPLPFTVTSTAVDGSLTFSFSSDFSVTYAGWVATITNTSPNPIATQPAVSTATCQGATTSISLTTTGTNTYQWYNNGATNSNTGGTLIAGATNTSYSPSTASLGTAYYYCVVKNGCNVLFTTNTAAVIVNPLPAAITGTAVVCQGLTTSLFDITPGGTWGSSAIPVASVGTGGVVTGASAGNATISYTVLGCSSTKVVTVNPLPGVIGGTASVCVSATTTLNSTPNTGTWSSGTTGIAGIDASGVVSGVSSGLAIITYTLPTTCIRTANVSVNPLPALTVTPTSPVSVCMGDNAVFTANAPVAPFTLLSQDFNSGLGSWAITNTSGVAASYWQIATSPGYAGTVGNGTPMMQAASEASAGSTITKLTSPSFSTLGYGSANLTFNQFLISTIPDISVKIEYSIDGGSNWNPVLDELNAFSGSGVWSAAAPEVNVALPAGAIGQANVQLRWNYNASSFYWFIDNILVQASLPPATYAWSGATGLSCTTCATTIITPAGTGANLYSITATTSAGCTVTNGVTVSVNPVPAGITGLLHICEGANTTLNTTSTTGTWFSSNTANAVIGSSSGIVTGLHAGTTIISYVLPTGCRTTVIFTVNPSPASITGTPTVCAGLTTALNESVSGGTWISSAGTTASVGTSGIVTGNLAGTADISYNLPAGCFVVQNVTVNPLPSPITGSPVVCEGATTALSDFDAGGTWLSSITGHATVNASGIVSGITAGNTVIKYTLPTSCFITQTVTVNQSPAVITGPTHVCAGLTITLNNTTPLGTWASGSAGIASVDASGVVSGGTAGNTNISYTLSDGCYALAPVTVDPLPATITGLTEICENASSSLGNTSTGGAWSSNNTGIAAIDATGLMTGVAFGNTTITYTLPTSCIMTTDVTINPLPASITGTMVVCENAITTLSDVTTGGTWSSGDISIATVDASGNVTGVATGIVPVTYMTPAGCIATTPVTVNHTPVAISGTPEVCENASISLFNTDAGGNWTSDVPSVATIDGSGNVAGITAGNSNISYTLVTGCYTSVQLTVDPLPAAITGPAVVCEASAIILNDITPGGSWSSGASGIASVDVSGTVTGVSAGNTMITYQLPTGCISSAPVLVNPLPAPITGTLTVCQGLTTLLSNTTSGGSWSSSIPAVAIVSASGNVTGIAAGNVDIIYRLSTGCFLPATVTVNPLPAAITGNSTVCEGLAITLNSLSPGGAWNSSPAGITTVDASGVVTGIAAGVSSVTYTLPTSCIATTTTTVNPTPAPVTGIMHVCQGLTTNLSSLTPGGAWSSSAPLTASVNTSGLVSGIAQGMATITYTLPAGCTATTSLTVDPLPAPITGATTICVEQTSALVSTGNSGTWSSSIPAVAAIDAAGTVTGIATGYSFITYTLPTGCIAATVVSVNPTPAPITGNSVVCQGQTSAFSDISPGGAWSSSAPGIASVNTAGTAIGLSPGLSVITYSFATGCKRITSLLVNPLPAAITGTTSVCAGLTTTLDNTTPGGSWSSATTVVSINEAGTVLGIAAGTTFVSYTLATGCARVKIVTVNQLPGLITGAFGVCEGATTILNNTILGGSWSTGSPANVIADPASGVVTGVAAGTANITYTLPTGCLRSRVINVNPAVLPITGTANVCRGLTTTLNDPTTGGAWISDNTSVASVNAVTGVLTGNAAGTVKISYAITTGCVATAIVTVNPLPAPITGSFNVCFGATTHLTNTSAGGTWASSNTSVAGIDASGLVTAVATGGTTITYTLPTGCLKTASLVVDPLPLIDTVYGGGSYCAGGVGFNIGLNGSGLATTYKLYNGSLLYGTAPGSGTHIDFGFNTDTGTYSVTAISAAGCVSNMSGTAVIHILPLVTPSVTLASDHGDNICAGTITTYTATPVFGGTTPVFDWRVNGVSMGAAGTFTYTPSNGDIVTATITSNEACPMPLTATDMMAMTVVPVQMPSVHITTTASDTLCLDDTAAFHAISSFGGTAPVLTWLKNGTNVGAGADFTYMPSVGDIIVCKLNSNYRCRLADSVLSNPVSLTIDSAYIPSVAITSNPGLVIAQGQNATLTADVNGAGPAPLYLWQINGVAVPGATNNTFSSSTFANNDIITCYVYGSGKCGLVSFNSVTMTVNDAEGITLTATAKGNISLLPNPNNGGFTLKGTLGNTADQETTIEVTDLLGQIVYRSKMMVHNGIIDQKIQLSNTIANGMYMLNLISGTEHNIFHFVVKQ